MPVFLTQPEIIDMTVGFCIFSTTLLSGAWLLNRTSSSKEEDYEIQGALPFAAAKKCPMPVPIVERLSESDDDFSSSSSSS